MADTLLETLRADLNAARRARAKERTLVLGTTLSEARNREIELGRALDDDETRAVIGTAVKKREEAAHQMREAGRTELADREDAEAEILRGYLPEPLGEAEVRAMAREAVDAGAADLGAVMRSLMPRIRGRFEGREANRLAREALDEG
ncbi:MAG TPA: GatB/YqeY domain-containing protein [Longimicrobiales bacterium]|nr:GatB/YqeY domain-containing protein [Longimicrobiales bacterium]